MIKQIRTGVACGLALLTLVGCGAPKTTADRVPGSQQAAGGEPVELTVAGFLGMSREALDDVNYEFRKKHPGVNVRVKDRAPLGKGGQPEESDLEGIDAVILPLALAGQMAEAGMLKDLSNLKVPAPNEAVAGIFDELGTAEGKRFALPIDVSPAMFVINEEQLNKAGIKELPQDWTWQDFGQVLATTKSAGITNMVQVSALLEPALRAYGGQLYDQDRQAWSFDSSAAKQGLAVLADLVKKDLVQADVPGGATTMAIRIGGKDGPALMALGANKLMSVPGMNMHPYPRGPQGRPVAASATVAAIPKSSPNAELATDYVREFLSNPAAQLALAKGGIRPVTADARALSAWQEAVGERMARATDLALAGLYAEPSARDIRPVLEGLLPYFRGTAGLDETVAGLIARLPQ